MRSFCSILFCCIILFQLTGISNGYSQGKNFYKGLIGKDSLTLERVSMASVVLPGFGQAYNKDYVKLGVFYAGAASLLYGGYHFNSDYHKTGNDQSRNNRNMCYAGVGVLYISSLVDAVASYPNQPKNIVPKRASFFSTFVPGLGQAYNGDYWKIPIIYGGLALMANNFHFNNMQYQRYRDAYNALTDEDPGTVDEFNGRIPASTLQYYRNGYRRNRDYSVLYGVLIYIVNIIDANVFAHLKDFDVSDNLSLNVKPDMITGNSQYLSLSQPPTFGIKVSFTLK